AGGLSLWIDLGAPVSSRLTMAARRHEVLLAAGPRFGLDGAFERYLRLPYTVRPDRADTALDRLAMAWRELDTPAAAGDADPAAVA
ncbi:MAG: PLP-dependent aminotransferase family protein, partial [Pseudonocardiales bacterium]|nr:PLP-dependent aminotransferase family protein [Pseudonocardiales bacterium]